MTARAPAELAALIVPWLQSKSASEALAELQSLAEQAEALREALIGLKLATDCWCLLADHDYGCLAARAALDAAGAADSQERADG